MICPFYKRRIDFHVNEKALCCKDEIGVLGESLEKVRGTLYQIVRSIKEASGHITETESVVKERSNDSRINSKRNCKCCKQCFAGSTFTGRTGAGMP